MFAYAAGDWSQPLNFLLYQEGCVPGIMKMNDIQRKLASMLLQHFNTFNLLSLRVVKSHSGMQN
jgi:hypothetical protein